MFFIDFSIYLFEPQWGPFYSCRAILDFLGKREEWPVEKHRLRKEVSLKDKAIRARPETCRTLSPADKTKESEIDYSVWSELIEVHTI